jgi:KDO2-lipid IV(A) lauroyltransferase
MEFSLKAPGKRRTLRLFDCFLSLIAGGTKGYASRLGHVLGNVAYAVDLRHRRIVARNLAFAFPERSAAERKQINKRTFRNAATVLLEICEITRLSKRSLIQQLRIKGENNLRNVLKDPRGVLMISAHLGNWEMAHLAVSCYGERPILLVARQIRPDIVNQWLNRLRQRFGSVIVDKKNALPKMARSLKRREIVGLLIDQEPKHSRGVDVAFFDKPTAVTPGPALLARRYECPIVPVFCVREEDGKLTLIVEPSIEPRKTEDFDGDLRENVQAMTRAVERAIRCHPEQWFWFHKRWKHHFPYLYKEDLNRLKRRRAKRRA